MQHIYAGQEREIISSVKKQRRNLVKVKGQERKSTWSKLDRGGR